MNTEKIMEDIQSVQDNIREIKSTCGNTIMTLDNIKSGLKADVQKKVDEAYQRGHDDGYEAGCATAFKPVSDAEYQRGLEDAWEAARKIIRMPDGDILDLFPDCYASVCTAVQAILKYDASEAIAKLKAYESKTKVKWIPVTEATPTEDDDYWATFEAETGRFVDWASWYQGRWVVWIDGSPAPLSNVIAWRKPMEPYKGGQHEDISCCRSY